MCLHPRHRAGRELQNQHPCSTRCLPAIPASAWPWRHPKLGSCLSPLSGAQSWAHPTLCLQVTPFPETYRETLHAYKISEQDTDVRANACPACPVLLSLSPAAGLLSPQRDGTWCCPGTKSSAELSCLLVPHVLCHPGWGLSPCNESSGLETFPRTIYCPKSMSHVLAASCLCQGTWPWLSTEPFARVNPIARLSSSPPFLFPPRGQKLLGKLCEQNKVLREQERLVQQLRAEKVRGGQLKQLAGDKPGCMWWS